eukprot:2098291-Rhodomonas_salina.1
MPLAGVDAESLTDLVTALLQRLTQSSKTQGSSCVQLKQGKMRKDTAVFAEAKAVVANGASGGRKQETAPGIVNLQRQTFIFKLHVLQANGSMSRTARVRVSSTWAES